MLITYAEYSLKDATRCCASRVPVAPLRAVRVLFVAILSLCLGGCKPPNLSACTHLEVRYTNGALNYFFPHSAWQETVLNEEERARVRSYDTWTVTDQERIKAFAYHISQGTYADIVYGNPKTQATVIGYQGKDRTITLSVLGMSIVTESKRRFTYPPSFLSLTSLDPPGLRPLQVRWDCGTNLSALIYEGLWPGPGPRPYLDPNHWCDSIVAAYRSLYVFHQNLTNKKERMYPDAAIARRFACPNVHAPADGNDTHPQSRDTKTPSQTPDTWTSDYAMNPNCRGREESPKDIVFLFESKPGWNQHGGPELFTFDNHAPKGGLVLLNDGTVKFVRTEEELKQLRWK